MTRTEAISHLSALVAGTFMGGEDDPERRKNEEALATLVTGLDEERLAQAIQTTILTSPDQYMGQGMGAYRTLWADLTDRQRRHVRGDARALADEYTRLAQPGGDRIADANGDELEHGNPDYPGQFDVTDTAQGGGA